jgi:hypothetical protein
MAPLLSIAPRPVMSSLSPQPSCPHLLPDLLKHKGPQLILQQLRVVSYLCGGACWRRDGTRCMSGQWAQQ